MTSRGDRWELGSEFHWPDDLHPSRTPSPWDSCEHAFGGTGRDVLRLLLEHPHNQRRWKRIWVPSYFCPDVVYTLAETSAQPEIYRDIPTAGTLAHLDLTQVSSDDCILVVNQFGLRARPDYSRLKERGVQIIEDHTHDPWSHWAATSSADYCLASLRKVLPIPDGAVTWSNVGASIPAQPPTTRARDLASGEKRAAMNLKRAYLEGGPGDKATYLEKFKRGEAILAEGEVSGPTDESRAFIARADHQTWRAQRAANLAVLSSALIDMPGIHIPPPPTPANDQVALSQLLLTETAELRNELRSHLIRESIFPAVLWPLGDPIMHAGPAELDFSQRCLSIHVDGRYNTSDMWRIAEAIGNFSRVWAGTP